MNYAIIGMGFIYNRHVEAIELTGGKIIMKCDIDPEKGGDFTNYMNMLEDPRMETVDAVVVCTPNYLHAEMIRNCIRAGKQVLCEKPLTINTDFSFLGDAAVVLQLRYHPKFNEICDALRVARGVNVVLKAYRDEHFWNCWKGDELKSGGVIYVLGSHIFDLLICALGDEYEIVSVNDGPRVSSGVVRFGDTDVRFHMEFLDSREGQTRHLEIDGEKFVLSLKDNLSFEGLHDKVYEAFIKGEAPSVWDVEPSIRLIDKLKKFK